MDAATDLSNDVWVWVEVLAIVGIGAVGVVVVGIGWASTLTLYLLLASMVLFLLSLVLGPGVFCLLGCYFREVHWCLVVAGFVADKSGVWAWLWGQAYPLIPNMFSSLR